MAEEKDASTSTPLSQGGGGGGGEDPEDPAKSPPSSPNSSTRKVRSFLASAAFSDSCLGLACSLDLFPFIVVSCNNVCLEMDGWVMGDLDFSSSSVDSVIWVFLFCGFCVLGREI